MALRRRRDGAAAGEHVVMQSGPSQSMPVSGGGTAQGASAVVAVAEKTARTRPAEPEDGPPGPEVYVVPVPAGTVCYRRRTCGKLRRAHRIIATAGCPHAQLGCNRGRWRTAARGTTMLPMTAS